jgi:hypothetical protein
MTLAERGRDARSPGPPGGLGYPDATMVARAARDPNGRGGPERRKQDGTA